MAVGASTDGAGVARSGPLVIWDGDGFPSGVRLECIDDLRGLGIVGPGAGILRGGIPGVGGASPPRRRVSPMTGDDRARTRRNTIGRCPPGLSSCARPP